MSEKTGIEWTDSTLNAEMGCNGCELWTLASGGTCYAAELVGRYGGSSSGYPDRFDRPKLYPWRILEACRWPDLTGTARPDKPWLDDMPRLVFLDDMGDTYTETLDDLDYLEGLSEEILSNDLSRNTERQEMLFRSWEAVLDGGHWLDPWIPRMAAAPCIWQVLTKRARRMRGAFERIGGVPANFWPMTSVTSAANRGRIDHLLRIPGASVYGLSYEPMLGLVDLAPYADRLDWCVLGGESGPRARETPVEWFEAAIEALDAGGCKVFVKQAGKLFAIGAGRKTGAKGGDPDQWPEVMRRREIPISGPLALSADDSLPADGQGMLFDLVDRGLPAAG